MAHILILEDNVECSIIYQDILRADHHEIEIVGSLSDLSKRLVNSNSIPDLFIADLKLPDGFFIDWVLENRPQLLVELNTIIVSSLEDMEILTRCFEWGAVDYLIKPFNKNELVVKVNRALGHFNVKKNPLIDDDLALVQDNLTVIESKIFQQLLNHPKKFVSRDMIVQEVWKKVAVNSKTLDVHLSNIRKKLAESSWSIDYQDATGWKLIKLQD
jgi:DNA-binding response OmpR family regulator